MFRAEQNIYAQVIDDTKGHTLAAASSLDKTLREALKTGANKDAATAVGKLLAERALAAGVTQVVFDRGSYLYHGRVKALGRDAARRRRVGLPDPRTAGGTRSCESGWDFDPAEAGGTFDPAKAVGL